MAPGTPGSENDPQGPPPTSPREEKRPSPPDSSWGFLLDVLSSPVVDFTWDYFVEDLVGEASASSVKAETDSLLCCVIT